MPKLKKLLPNRLDVADSMVVVGIFLAFIYWALESLLNIFSPEEVNFYRQLFGPHVSDVWGRIILLCLFVIFGSHVQFTINKRKQAEQALKESEEKYRTILESMEEGYYEVDFDSNFTFVNDSMSAILGCPKNEILALNYRQFMNAQHAEILEENFNNCRRSAKPIKAFDCEFNKDGLVVFIEASCSLLKDPRDEPIGFRGIIRDRTEKKKLEMHLLESQKKLQEARAATILGLAKLAEYRDEGTGTHLERIREYSKMLAEEMVKRPQHANLINQRYIDDIFQSSILHDIGKVGIPDAILLKPGKLTAEEFKIIQLHPTLGGDAIRVIESRIEGRSFLVMGKEIAYSHHEKWDGSGYPKGLKGKEIPLSARIVALADVYDALTTKRFYKNAYSHEDSMQIILNLRGGHFDPEIVDVFLSLEGAFDRVREDKLKEEMALIDQPARAMHY